MMVLSGKCKKKFKEFTTCDRLGLMDILCLRTVFLLSQECQAGVFFLKAGDLGGSGVGGRVG